jgi:phospho-N-acetylmuramoyl-pentapeptide-transferase
MGDTGANALGGFVASTAIILRLPVFLLIIAVIYVMESLSVIIQVGYYKLTKKRFFKMAPIHHHFELSGWAEQKVVVRMWILGFILALLGLASLKIL